MADDAFALSPISAHASMPGEADYEAIRDAFMETARGRWFLTEYARRNRNVDTGMVLDAVARIEAGLVVRGATSPSHASLLSAIRPLIATARDAADAAMASPDSEALRAAARRGTRIIREIAWSLRESGADTRICDILDSQLSAIDRLQDDIQTDARRAEVSEVFDDLVLEVEAIASGIGTSQRAAAPAAPEPKPEPEPEPVERVGANIESAFAESAGVAREAAIPAAAPATHDAPDYHAPTDDERAADDALLDRVAMEMAAPDIDDVDDFDGDDGEIAELRSLAASPPTRPAPTMASAPSAPALPEAAAPVSAKAAQVSSSAEPTSLGAALLANGIVRAPGDNDPLAPFRRMSQVEKIAFFS